MTYRDDQKPRCPRCKGRRVVVDAIIDPPIIRCCPSCNAPEDPPRQQHQHHAELVDARLAA